MSDRIAVMDKGRVLQVGTPREIYTRPADRFVAGFIGETNFMPCTVVSSDRTRAIARMGDGFTVEVESEAAFANGTAATLSVRPEHARVIASRQSGLLDATIENLVFVGSGLQLHARLNDGSSFMVLQPDSGKAAPLEIGQLVSIAINDGAARLLRN
jgi:spermidine/putrescine transport system ATP-binding protein